MKIWRMAFAAAAAMAAALANAAPKEVQCASFETDRPEAQYRCGETVTFTVRPTWKGRGTIQVDDWSEKALMKPLNVDSATAETFRVSAKLEKPGFVRIRYVCRDPETKGYKASFWAVAYEPEKIRPGAGRPADFDAYWEGEIRKLDETTPVDAKFVLDEERSAKGDTDYYRLSVQSTDRRIYGFLSKPKGKGPFPVFVSIPGAGFGNGNFPAPMPGKVYFTANVFDFEPGQEPGVVNAHGKKYDAMQKRWGEKFGTRSVWAAGIGSPRREDYFYHGAILGINRALNFVLDLPFCDRADVEYRGQSQGGAFGIFLSALNGRITRATISEPAITDLLGNLREVSGSASWPCVVNAQATDEARENAERNAPYYDGANFCARIKCPVRFMAGYVDGLCPPQAVWAGYNSLPADTPKAMVDAIGCGHGVPHDVYHAWDEKLSATPWPDRAAKTGDVNDHAVGGSATDEIPKFGAKPKKGQWDLNVKKTEKPCVTWRKFLSADLGLGAAVGRIRPRAAKEIGDSPWSVDCCGLDREMSDYDMYAPHLAALGAKYARINSGWAKTEQEKGRYDFAWLDHVVDGMIADGVRPWVALQYGNPLYGSDYRLGTKIRNIVANPAAYEGWLRYVEATVARYRGRVRAWEIWNEPFRQGKDYAELVSKTAALIRRLQPEARILVSAMDPSDQDECLARWKDEPTKDYINAWCFHPYWGRPEGNWDGQTPDLLRKIRAVNPGWTVVQGEAGCPSQLEYSQAMNGIEWTEYAQAKWDLRRAFCDYAEGVKSSCFSMTDTMRTYMIETFGLIRMSFLREFIYLRPSYHAMQHVYALIDCTASNGGWKRNVPFKVLKEGDLNPHPPKTLAVSRFAYLGGHKAVALWFDNDFPSASLRFDRIEFATDEVSFREPVLVEMVTGRAFELGPSRIRAEDGRTVFTDIPAWDSPVVIAARGELPLIREE